MAKKVRRKPEEEAAPKFEFPVFDEVGFVTKEFELTAGLVLASLFAILLGLFGWVLTAEGVNGFVPFGIGILVVILTPYAVRRLRSRSSLFTKGDWAGLLALEFFGWLALWFVLTNVSPML
jgi:hypothetical protein